MLLGCLLHDVCDLKLCEHRVGLFGDLAERFQIGHRTLVKLTGLAGLGIEPRLLPAASSSSLKAWSPNALRTSA